MYIPFVAASRAYVPFVIGEIAICYGFSYNGVVLFANVIGEIAVCYGFSYNGVVFLSML